MMKIAMRLDKSQIKKIHRFTTPGSTTFDRDLAVMAGMTRYEAIIIGAAGGTSGLAKTDKNNVGDQGTTNDSGGGGGGMLHLKGDLLDLAKKTTIVVGAVGVKGADGATDGPAGNGTPGGNTSFGAYVAYGGKGGIGAHYNSIIRDEPQIEPHYINVVTRGAGGDGGGNSANLGSGGVGGKAQMYEYINGQPQYTDYVLPTNGVYAISAGTDPVVGGSHGGGGGSGRVVHTTGASSMARYGADGAWGGFAPVASTGSRSANAIGGCGGGASVAALVGATYEQYGVAGDDGSGHDRNGHGALVLILS